MIFLVVAFALLLHGLLWGAGLAMLVIPRPWRRFWPVLIFAAGWALQSLVVWVGAYANLRGTNAYAWPAELVPVVLLAVGLRRLGVRAAWTDLTRFGLVWGIVVGVTLALVLPMVIASRGLTTASLGSCDAADYAAGARVFMEFARSDRSGFLGLTEVVRVMSADNFFDFWLRLNHFTPSAVIALNGSILDCAPHELTGVFTAVVLAASTPLVFWMARALFGYSGVASLVIAAIYGISPITWYSVAQISPAPLLAAQGLAVLTWGGVSLWNARLTWSRVASFGGVLAIGYAIVLGAYNFILLVGLTPVVAYAGGRAIRVGAWPRLVRWLLAMLVPLAVAGLIFWDRVAGLVERFMLFQTYDFGWKIPVLTPEGWLGMVQGGGLQPWSWFGVRWLLALLVLVPLGWAILRPGLAGRRRLWLVASATIPVLAGYTFLELRGALLGTNASYDAFKLFAVFYPLLLPAFCWWITLRWSSRFLPWLGVAALAIVVTGFNALACVMFIVHLSRPPLIVDGELRQLRKLESVADVSSVNLLIPDMWSRLWANAFLLRKPQYFLTHTYEGRLNTPLRGEWDLVSGPVRVRLPDAGTRAVTTHYQLNDTRAPAFLRVELGDGWHAEERLANGERWTWTRGDATVRVENPHAQAVTADLLLDGRTVEPREITVERVGGAAARVAIGNQRATYQLGRVTFPPGRSILKLGLGESASATGDARQLGICVFELALRPSADH